jgi:hypothetical protein
MNKTIQFVFTVAVIAALGVAATAVMSPMSAHADKPPAEVCVHNGNGDNKCTGGNSATHCERVHGKYECS